MGRAVTASLVASLAFLAGCAEDEPSGTTAPARTEMLIEGAPAPVQLLPDSTDCGAADLPPALGPPRKVPGELRCLRQARRAGAAARVKATQYTIEGDPIVSYIWTRPATDDLVWVTDTTADRFGPREWTAQVCAGIGARGFPVACSKGIEVDDRTPVAVIERSRLRNCGQFGVADPRGRNESVRKCVDAAISRSGDVEYRHVEPSEEHPRERIVRLLPGRIEVFEDSGGYSPADHRWSYTTCKSIDGESLEPRGCEAVKRFDDLGP